ncbi:fructosamine kinase [Mycolicibacterium duvalii]|uniref:Fructosamine kinase n=1 Tax=Mycolicibacterium duvalii TaxID=39688 RepID=A0A7I7K576_9MYCO|nr:fructosamine kinase family protein [Mycolicibacterium duvalii]MCV7368824.1 fructosamine kinase family protein [Mycolicibacterium duvalii]PEG44330.1 fructosamine kinase [Mycolicibacterium duvalii]BBX19280.1 fructosamine kinase [Mycolicibacterium duvalii]
MHFVKAHSDAPAGFFACEAAGLHWLSRAEGGVPCARVLAVDERSLTLERLISAGPDASAAHAFGARLAHTHAAGADGFGAAPPDWTGTTGFFGPLQHPLPMSYCRETSWGRFYAEHRLSPMAEVAGPRLDTETARTVAQVVARCRAGDFDDDDVACRLHGDLWAGNVMWTPDGVVLIDPAAHGGHRETDLAMLALFGCPHLEAVLTGYQSVFRLRAGWRDRTGLHQLYPLLAHVALFGASYVGATRSAARSALATLSS